MHNDIDREAEKEKMTIYVACLGLATVVIFLGWLMLRGFNCVYFGH